MMIVSVNNLKYKNKVRNSKQGSYQNKGIKGINKYYIVLKSIKGASNPHRQRLSEVAGVLENGERCIKKR